MSSQEALQNRNIDGHDNYKGQGTRFDLKASLQRLREAFIDSAYKNRRNLLDHFDVYDYEGHGNYEFTDFKTMMMELNLREYSDLEMKDMMDYLDINSTGQVSKREFFDNLMRKDFEQALHELTLPIKPILRQMARIL